MPAARPARRRQPRMPIEQRREQVLDAALRLIAHEGYGATSMEAIAREADLAKPVVYNAFPGRGPLLRALLEREEGRALRALGEALPPQALGSDPVRTLLAWLRSLAETIAENPQPWRLMLMPADETPAVVREHVARGRGFALTQARALIAGLFAGRPGLAGLDQDLAAHSLLAMGEHCARLLIEQPEEYPPARLVDYARAVLRAFGDAPHRLPGPK